MASIEKRRNKEGKITSVRIIMSDGLDLSGKQIQRRKTWIPRPGMTKTQIDRDSQIIHTAPFIPRKLEYEE